MKLELFRSNCSADNDDFRTVKPYQNICVGRDKEFTTLPSTLLIKNRQFSVPRLVLTMRLRFYLCPHGILKILPFIYGFTIVLWCEISTLHHSVLYYRHLSWEVRRTPFNGSKTIAGQLFFIDIKIIKISYR